MDEDASKECQKSDSLVAKASEMAGWEFEDVLSAPMKTEWRNKVVLRSASNLYIKFAATSDNKLAFTFRLD